jgi:hypothetical protein
MKFLGSLKWWHWLLAGVAVIGIYVAWTRFRKKGVSVDTVTSEIKVYPLKAV